MKGRIYNKLCEVNDASRAEAMASKTQYSCAQCGAISSDAKSVCAPIELPSN